MMSILDESVFSFISVDEEEKKTLENFQGKKSTFSSVRIEQLIYESVCKYPDNIAVVHNDSSYTYKEFWKIVCGIESLIISRSVCGSVIAVADDPSIERIASIVAVLKSGNVFMPLDLSNPDSRLHQQIKDAKAKVLLINDHSVNRFSSLVNSELMTFSCAPENVEVTKPDGALPATQTAYIIYTSGSTGVPKGCGIKHRSLVNRLEWMIRDINLTPKDVILHKTSFAFDVSVWEQLLAFIVGGCVVLASEQDKRDAGRLVSLMQSAQVTVTHFVPTMLSAFLEEEVKELLSLRRIICSGEELPLSVSKKCHDLLPGAILSNYYGPTEATIDVTSWVFNINDNYSFVPIGLPIDNVTARVLKDDLTQAPIGVEGELYLGGDSVGIGYINRSALTAERFIPDEYSNVPGARLYKTGDRVIRHENGCIEYLGRADQQVKIKGFRIELGEIEEVIRQVEGVKNVVVIAADNNLVAYVAGVDSSKFDYIKSFCKGKLAPYMIPQHWIAINEVPVTDSGKVNRKALPSYKTAFLVSGPMEKPSNEKEQVIAEIWKNLLKIPEVDVNTDFFTLGGDSILAIRMATALRKCGYSIEVKDVFDFSTIKKLSHVLKGTPKASSTVTSKLSDIWKNIDDISALVTGVYTAVNLSSDKIGNFFEKVENYIYETRLVSRDEVDGGLNLGPYDNFPVLHVSDAIKKSALLTANTLFENKDKYLFVSQVVPAGDGEDKIVISFLPHLIDWASLYLIPKIINKDIAQYNEESISYSEWASVFSNAHTNLENLNTEFLYSNTKKSSVMERNFKFSISGKPNFSSGIDSILVDVGVSSVLKALNSVGVAKFYCRFPESRALAASVKYDVANVFGRLSHEAHGLVKTSIESDIALLRSIRQGGAALSDMSIENPIKAKFIFVGGSDGSENENDINLSLKSTASLADNLLGENDLLVLMCLDKQDIEINWVWNDGDYSSVIKEAAAAFDIFGREKFLREDLQKIRVSTDYPMLNDFNSHLIEDIPFAPHDIFPLSPTQEGMLLRAMYWPNSDAYHNQNVIELLGPLNSEKLISSWNIVVNRYEILRAGYISDKNGLLLQYSAYSSINEPQTLDWTNIPAADLDDHINSFLDADRANLFRLHEAGLWRFYLAKVSDQHHIVIWSHHHILLDGWCLSLIWGDVFKSYDLLNRGEKIKSFRPRAYKDYMAWLGYQKKNSESSEYWKNYLQGFDQPTNYSKKPVDLEGAFDTWRIVLSENKTAEIANCAKALSITPNAIIQAAWGIMLSLRAGTADTIHGVSVSGRPHELPGSEYIVGLFINTVPLRLKYDGSTLVADYLRNTQKTLAEATKHAQLPLSEITAHWKGRRASTDRIFDSLIAFENYPEDNLPEEQLGDLRIVDRFCNEKTEYPIGLIVLPGKKMELHFNFDKSHFTSHEIQLFVDLYQAIVFSIAQDSGGKISALPYVDDFLNKIHHARFPNKFLSKEKSTIFDLIKNNGPQEGSIIVDEQGNNWDYDQLFGHINKYIAAFREYGVRAGDVVSIETNRSAFLAIAFLALLELKAIPAIINPKYSAKIKVHCLDTSNARYYVTNTTDDFLISEIGSRVKLIKQEDLSRLSNTIDHQSFNPGYRQHGNFILFTSGSTGLPKCILCSEIGLVERLTLTRSIYEQGVKDVLLANAAPGFDILLWELFYPLAFGGKLIIADELTTLNPDIFSEKINSFGVTIFHLIPSILRNFIEGSEGSSYPTLRCVVTGGEIVSPDLVNTFYKQFDTIQLWQGYGPSEASISITDHRCTNNDVNSDRVPIGVSLGESRAYVLDAFMRPVMNDVEGDIYIIGTAIAKGYLGAAALSADAFLPNPYGPNGSVMYKTGDKGYWNQNNELEFLGRSDRIVKFLGQRVDLDQMELVLKSNNVVGNAVVEMTRVTLVAFVVPNSNSSKSQQQLKIYIRSWMAMRMPNSPGISNIIFMEDLPKTPNGKIDRQLLAGSVSARPEKENNVSIMDMSPVEKLVSNAWENVLGEAPLSREDNFFECGGHSLAAVQLVRELRKNLQDGQVVEVSHVFKFPTFIGISEAILSRKNGSFNEHIIDYPSELKDKDRIPVFFIHPVEGMSNCYQGIGKEFKRENIYSLNNPRLFKDNKFLTLEQMASLYVEWVRTLSDDGPVKLAGWSFGGVVALEMARQMREHHGDVVTVLMIDSYNISGKYDYLKDKSNNLQKTDDDAKELLANEILHSSSLAVAHTVKPYDGKIVLLKALDEKEYGEDTLDHYGWNEKHFPDLEVVEIAGSHHKLFNDDYFSSTCEAIEKSLKIER
jgi:nocardicin nonribosomal peptide synthetase NocB